MIDPRIQNTLSRHKWNRLSLSLLSHQYPLQLFLFFSLPDRLQ